MRRRRDGVREYVIYSVPKIVSVSVDGDTWESALDRAVARYLYRSLEEIRGGLRTNNWSHRDDALRLRGKVEVAAAMLMLDEIDPPISHSHYVILRADSCEPVLSAPR
jgi:hypothetical protein